VLRPAQILYPHLCNVATPIRCMTRDNAQEDVSLIAKTTMSSIEREHASEAIINFGDGSFRIDRADNLTRRYVMGGFATGGITLALGAVPLTPALAVIPGSGIASEVISKTFGTALGELGAKLIMNTNIASVFGETERDMQASGHRPRTVRGFRSVQQEGVVTLDDGECFGVATDYRAGCFCIVLPPEVGVLRSCLDHEIGLPAAYRRAGHQFGIADVLRYVTVVRAERRRGRCGTASIFHTWSGYVLQIEPYNACYAHVAICNPKTGKRLENAAVPTDSTNDKVAPRAGEWKIV
jgi:hypothetical protein